jgi:hypothetical protein
MKTYSIDFLTSSFVINVSKHHHHHHHQGVSISMGNPRAAAAKALGTTNIIQKVRELIIKRGGSSGIVSLGR